MLSHGWSFIIAKMCFSDAAESLSSYPMLREVIAHRYFQGRRSGGRGEIIAVCPIEKTRPTDSNGHILRRLQASVVEVDMWVQGLICRALNQRTLSTVTGND